MEFYIAQIAPGMDGKQAGITSWKSVDVFGQAGLSKKAARKALRLID